MSRLLFALILMLFVSMIHAQEEDATLGVWLEGFAVLPADTFAEGPASGSQIHAAYGRTPPFEKQPVQGFSDVLKAGNGHFYAMSDNGYGARANSQDYNLRFYELDIDFASGMVEVIGFTELSDPDNLIPWDIVNGGTRERILTGADLDIESFRQVADGSFWFGEEFGPYLLHTDAEGHLLQAPIPTPYPALLAPYARGLAYIQSADNPDLAGLTEDARRAAANLPSSKGFEGLALNTSGTMLYPLLEGVMFDDPQRNRLLIQEFDLEVGAYSGRHFFYPMSHEEHAVGAMTAINDHEILVIERDNEQGADAQFKRIYRVDLAAAGPDGMLEKSLLVDLMHVGDPDGHTQAEDGAMGFGEIFSFPFATIESVLLLDADTLLVMNDNNYPLTSGRRPGIAPDDNEFILLKLPVPLQMDAG